MAENTALDALINGDFRDAFNAPDYFSESSTAHIFDVVDGKGSMSDVNGCNDLREILKVGPSSSPRAF